MESSLITDADPLLNYLNGILAQSKKRESEGDSRLAEFGSSDEPTTHYKVYEYIHSLNIGGLRDLIISDCRFVGNTKLLIRHIGGGASGFYPDTIPITLVRRLIRTEDPLGTIAWLQKLLSLESTDGWLIQLLWNISISQRIAVTPDIYLVPLDQVPAGINKEWAKELESQFARNPVTYIGANTKVGALMMRVTLKPVLCTLDTVMQPHKTLEWRERLQSVARLLTLFGPSPVSPDAMWGTFNDKDINDALTGSSRQNHYHEITPRPHNTTVEVAIHESELMELVAKYLAIVGEAKLKIDIALLRLNRALRRADPGDAMVELAIAFEALVGDGNTEMTHKVKVRSARLLGGAEQIRVQNSKIFYDVYAARSTLVHTGALKDKWQAEKTKMSASELVRASASLCADLIKKMIDLGSIPEWHTFDVTEHLENQI
jgi:hypothetical protein